ncbi:MULTISPECIES: MBL fold metallo-hydrolase [Corallococcus]|uniref:MBL fold metallo-hydrolase n=1 Tax=Corallococcus TaxID=83461 RepID=UPI000ED9616E|nr:MULTISPECIES: MBL fold metallo-hydrolase [Corallococcus]NNB90504.1 MBL fold metallo-hydrolase [Corallococcus exiguus]RKI01706.1 MBL fold metallo-hydrolase [Corallococcus sp. AB038B]
MLDRPMYLKPDVAIEPLFNQWYVWWYLISPATAPLFVSRLHLKLMQSFVANPDVHVAALQNPALMGGPFINHPVSRVNEVKALLDRTTREQADMLAYTKAVSDLEQLLASSKGESLEPLYAKVPDMLRGFVELHYDLAHRANARIMEPLLYRSSLYKESAQSISLMRVAGDARKYVFSTPRLEGDSPLWLQVPYKHEGIDALFRMRHTPGSPGQVAEMLGVPSTAAEAFADLFTETAPRKPEPYTGSGVRVRYFGHACVLMETREVSVLTDPVISYEFPTDQRRFTHADLPEKIDYVLITHGHADHLMMETLLQLRHRIGTIVVPRSNAYSLADPSLRLVLEQTGFKNVIEIDDLQEIKIPGGSLMGIPFIGEHSDLAVQAKTAHLVRLAGRSMLMAADSNALEPRMYQHLSKLVGPLDALYLGMECEGGPMSWMYGPLLSQPLPRKMDQSRRLNGSDSARATEILNHLNPKEVFIYAMGQEPWLRHVMVLQYDETAPQMIESNKFIEVCKGRNIPAARPFLSMEQILE